MFVTEVVTRNRDDLVDIYLGQYERGVTEQKVTLSFEKYAEILGHGLEMSRMPTHVTLTKRVYGERTRTSCVTTSLVDSIYAFFGYKGVTP